MKRVFCVKSNDTYVVRVGYNGRSCADAAASVAATSAVAAFARKRDIRGELKFHERNALGSATTNASQADKAHSHDTRPSGCLRRSSVENYSAGRVNTSAAASGVNNGSFVDLTSVDDGQPTASSAASAPLRPMPGVQPSEDGILTYHKPGRRDPKVRRTQQQGV